MKLVQISQDAFVFEFHPREREMLGAILALYPLLNPDYHQLTKRTGDRKVDESQELFCEAMAQQRIANKKLVTQLMDPANWPASDAGKSLLALDSEKIDWLLQVLNDVRVGSWVKLGKPNPEFNEQPEITIENLPYAEAMELAGLFQSVLLSVLAR